MHQLTRPAHYEPERAKPNNQSTPLADTQSGAGIFSKLKPHCIKRGEGLCLMAAWRTSSAACHNEWPSMFSLHAIHDSVSELPHRYFGSHVVRPWRDATRKPTLRHGILSDSDVPLKTDVDRPTRHVRKTDPD